MESHAPRRVLTGLITPLLTCVGTGHAYMGAFAARAEPPPGRRRGRHGRREGLHLDRRTAGRPPEGDRRGHPGRRRPHRTAVSSSWSVASAPCSPDRCSDWPTTAAPDLWRPQPAVLRRRRAGPQRPVADRLASPRPPPPRRPWTGTCSHVRRTARDSAGRGSVRVSCRTASRRAARAVTRRASSRRLIIWGRVTVGRGQSRPSDIKEVGPITAVSARVLSPYGSAVTGNG